MRGEGIEPNAISYTSLINAAKLDGSPRAVQLGYEVFLEMPAAVRNMRTVFFFALTNSLLFLWYGARQWFVTGQGRVGIDLLTVSCSNAVHCNDWSVGKSGKKRRSQKSVC